MSLEYGRKYMKRHGLHANSMQTVLSSDHKLSTQENTVNANLLKRNAHSPLHVFDAVYTNYIPLTTFTNSTYLDKSHIPKNIICYFCKPLYAETYT